MKKQIYSIILCTIVAFATSCSPNDTPQEAVKSYFKALGKGDIEAAISICAPEGVFYKDMKGKYEISEDMQKEFKDFKILSCRETEIPYYEYPVAYVEVERNGRSSVILLIKKANKWLLAEPRD